MKALRLVSILTLAALVLGAGLTACSKPADQEIQAADDALRAAKNVGADQTSPKLFEKAQTMLQDAKMLNEQGHFSEARKKADYARIRAEQAKTNAEKSGGERKERLGGAKASDAQATQEEGGD